MSRRTYLNVWLILSVFLLGLGGASLVAQPIFVDDDAPGPIHDGSSWTNGYTSLQDALTDAATSGHDIWVAAGIYQPAEPFSGNRDATFQLIDGVSIYGGLAGDEDPATFDPNDRDFETNETILSGDLDGDDGPNFLNNGENSYHVVTGSGADATAVLDGFTITGGHGEGGDQYLRYGSGMFNVHGSPTVSNCTFRDNSPTDGYGGGMYNEESSPTLSSCTFKGNSAGDNGAGGGMYNANSSPILTDCIFSGNWSYGGGGMCNDGSDPVLTNCTFSGNSTVDQGGGMYNRNESSPILTNCIFNNNSGKTGGGMRNSNSSSPILSDCIFSGNTVEGTFAHGGGLYNFDNSSPTLTNCTFTGNWAANDGGGIYNKSSSNPTLTNCIFWGNRDNSGMDESAQIHNESSTCDVNYSCVQGWTGALGGIGNIGGDPLLVEPGYMISYWKFDEGVGAIAYDSAGTNLGTIQGATWTTGQVGGALSFDGLDDYVDVGHVNVFDDEITISAWIRPDGAQVDWAKMGCATKLAPPNPSKNTDNISQTFR